jgi:hypothetical protein
MSGRVAGLAGTACALGLLAGCAGVSSGISEESLPGEYRNEESGATVLLGDDGRFVADGLPGAFIDGDAASVEVSTMRGTWSFQDVGGGVPFAMLMIETGGPPGVGNLQLFFSSPTEAVLDPDVDAPGEFVLERS